MNSELSNRVQRALGSYESGDVEAAIQQLGELIETAPDPGDRIELLFLQASWLSRVGRVQEAREFFNQAVELSPRTEQGRQQSDFAEADLLVSERNFKMALKKLEGLRQDYFPYSDIPDYKNLFEIIEYRRGLLLAGMERYDEAHPILEGARSYDVKKDGDYYYLLGLCELRKKRYDLAREALTKGFEVGYPSGYEVPAHFNLGMVYYHQGAYARAKIEFEACQPILAGSAIAPKDLFSWLAATCRALNLAKEAEKYERLAQ